MCPPPSLTAWGQGAEALTCKNQALFHHARVQGYRLGLGRLRGGQAGQQGLWRPRGSQVPPEGTNSPSLAPSCPVLRHLS